VPSMSHCNPPRSIVELKDSHYSLTWTLNIGPV
jgi:hypothetical protein